MPMDRATFLTEVRYLGPLRDDRPTKGSVSFSKFLIFVTLASIRFPFPSSASIAS